MSIITGKLKVSMKQLNTLSTEQLSNNLNALRMTYNNLDEFYMVELNSLLDDF